jgi:hypothetical protein
MVVRRVVLSSLLLIAAACGDDRDPPTSPSATRRPVGLTIVAPGPALGVGESAQLSAVVTYADGSREPAAGVLWATSQASVCALLPGGVLVAIGPGSATITAAAGGVSATTSLTVELRAGGLRRVLGRLVDFASDAPIAGATIRFASFGTDVTTATTDPLGHFTVALPTGEIGASIGGDGLGFMIVRVGGPAFRGDLVGNGGACIARYGTVTDATTFLPVAGATVRVGGGTAMSGPDGWYRIERGCVDDPFNNSNTTFLRATHPAYRDYERVAGRGVHRVTRFDVELQRSQP